MRGLFMICEWQRIKIKNLEDEILRLNTNLEGLNLVLQESTKEYMDEIVCKTDQINELKNTVENQEIMIDRMKCCGNCGIKQTNTGECENNNRYMTNDKYKCINYDMWILKED